LLSRKDNEYVTQVGLGTPMGNLFRRYWLPASLSEELPEPDCGPIRLKLKWTLVPDEHRNVSKRTQACNWLQNLEGEVDSSHANFLHAQLGPDRRPIRNDVRDQDLHPVFSILEADYGLAVCAPDFQPDRSGRASGAESPFSRHASPPRWREPPGGSTLLTQREELIHPCRSRS
jgi:hypothetical protein